MDFTNYQKQVDEWIKQYKVGYFSPLEIMAQLTEEQGELAEAIKKNDHDNIEEELAGVLFPVICLANSQDINLPLTNKKSSVSLSSESSITYGLFLELSKYSGMISRELSHLFGHKKKKETEHTEGLVVAMNELVNQVEYIADSYSINIDVAFEKHMNKLYHRDNNRWEKVK